MLILAAFCLSFVTNGYAQYNTSDIDRELTRLQKEGAFNGSVLVARKGKITYRKNVGLADFEHHVPIDSNTTFELASISKTFTALLILQLAESNQLRLDANVSDYIPEFTNSDSGNITIRHLLSHTSGLQDFVGLNCEFENWSDDRFIQGINKTPVRFKPGTRFEYASSTYILLRLIIERVAHTSYENILENNIFKPCGMIHSGVIHNRKIVARRAMGYQYSDHRYTNALPIANHNIFIGAASIYSTAGDLLRFDRALYTNTLLSENTKKQMFTINLPPYGYGWFVNDDSLTGKVVSHGGDIFGYTTLIERRLKDQLLIVILANLQSIDREAIKKVLGRTIK